MLKVVNIFILNYRVQNNETTATEKYVSLIRYCPTSEFSIGGFCVTCKQLNECNFIKECEATSVRIDLDIKFPKYRKSFGHTLFFYADSHYNSHAIYHNL